MKLCTLMILGCLIDLALHPPSAHAHAAVKKAHALNIGSGVPPAKILVTDTQGRRAGVDPAVTLSNVGLPPRDIQNEQLGILQEIPNTDVEANNYSSEGLKSATGWQVRIVDGGSQTYLVTLTGITAGVSRVRIGPEGIGGKVGLILPTYISVLVSAGDVRQLQVTFDPPASLVPRIDRIVTPRDLVSDIESACAQKLINANGVCRSLKAKAAAADKALTHGRTKAARGAVNAFLN